MYLAFLHFVPRTGVSALKIDLLSIEDFIPVYDTVQPPEDELSNNCYSIIIGPALSTRFPYGRFHSTRTAQVLFPLKASLFLFPIPYVHHDTSKLPDANNAVITTSEPSRNDPRRFSLTTSIQIDRTCLHDYLTRNHTSGTAATHKEQAS